jgi:hypothetical protein
MRARTIRSPFRQSDTRRAKCAKTPICSVSTFQLNYGARASPSICRNSGATAGVWPRPTADNRCDLPTPVGSVVTTLCGVGPWGTPAERGGHAAEHSAPRSSPAQSAPHPILRSPLPHPSPRPSPGRGGRRSEMPARKSSTALHLVPFLSPAEPRGEGAGDGNARSKPEKSADPQPLGVPDLGPPKAMN